MKARERRRQRAAESRGEVRVTQEGGLDALMADWTPHTAPAWAPWSGDPHFIEWAQTCPLGEWVRYEGPRFEARIYMTERPAADPQEGA